MIARRKEHVAPVPWRDPGGKAKEPIPKPACRRGRPRGHLARHPRLLLDARNKRAPERIVGSANRYQRISFQRIAILQRCGEQFHQNERVDHGAVGPLTVVGPHRASRIACEKDRNLIPAIQEHLR